MASAGRSRRLLEWASFFIVFLPLVLSQQSPTLTIMGGSSTVSVMENRLTGTELMIVRCTDLQDPATRAYIGSITPTNPCGSCFAVMPCDPQTKTKFCLYYNRGQGKLSYSSAPSYLARVFCTDDVNEVSATLEIRVIDNQPPTFTKPSSLLENVLLTGTHFKRPGAVIYDKMTTSDPEGDAVFHTMTQDPDYDLLEMGYADGKIRAKKDMRFLCEDDIRTTVTIKDVHNDAGSPALINIQFKGRNVRPVFTKKVPLILEKEHPDHLPVTMGKQILKLTVDDATLYKKVFKMKAEPKRGLEYYTLFKKDNAWEVRARKRLDYEYEPLRSVKLIFDVTDGFCEAETYSTVIQLKDVNELPQIVPAHVERTVYEGLIDIDPGWKVVDPDKDDIWTWSMVVGGEAFDVHPVSGRISSRGVFDVDPNTREKVRSIEVRVVDRNGERAKATMKITVIDKNDNVPEFTNRLVIESANECTPAGKQLRKISARDFDSRRDGNEDLIYSGDGENITVLATGHIVLKRQCTAGQKESMAVHVTDQGSYPGPLKGVSTTVSFTCFPCPPPPPNATDGGAGGRNWYRYWYRYYSRLRIGDFPNDMGDLSDLDGGLRTLLPWLIPALLLATLMLALMAYVCWRACRALIPRCRRCVKRPPKPPIKKRPPKKQLVPLKPMKKEDKVEVVKLTPPEPPPPEGDPRFFGFWKETYVDRDQRHFPERDTLPINVANDRIIQETEKVEEEEEKQQILWERAQKQEAFLMEVQNYEHELSQLQNPRPVPSNPPPPPKKSSFCSIS